MSVYCRVGNEEKSQEAKGMSFTSIQKSDQALQQVRTPTIELLWALEGTSAE